MIPPKVTSIKEMVELFGEDEILRALDGGSAIARNQLARQAATQGDYEWIGYMDNNYLPRQVKVNRSDDEVNIEQASHIMLLDRIATALEGILGYLHEKGQR